MLDTTHCEHALEVAKTLPLGMFDAILTVGGDGTVYEVLNGLALHEDPIKALKIPVAPVPTGSGNALSLNILGIQVRFLPYVQILMAKVSAYRRVWMSWLLR